MSKEYISVDRLSQTYENIVNAPLLDGAADYVIGVKDGRLYRVKQ